MPNNREMMTSPAMTSRNTKAFFQSISTFISRTYEKSAEYLPNFAFISSIIFKLSRKVCKCAHCMVLPAIFITMCNMMHNLSLSFMARMQKIVYIILII